MDYNQDVEIIKQNIEIFLKEASLIFSADFFNVNKDIKEKEHFRDLVTKTDLNIEELFRDWLKFHLPSHTFIGEESFKSQKLSNGWTWLIDPIDGTTNFIHKIPDCAIILSAIYNQIPQLSWILYPIKNELFFAQKGYGAFRNGERIRIHAGTSLKESLVYSIAPRNFNQFTTMYKSIWEKTLGVQVIGCMATTFTSLCMNQSQISIMDNAYIWEYAAGCLLVKEAGGACKSINGGEILTEKLKSSIIAANSEELLRLCLQEFEV